MKKHIPALFLFLALFVSSSLVAQSSQGIPYQAVMRNADGSVMASSEAVLTFMIHDGTANGTVVYQESHSLTSNAQGLVSCVVGNGTASQGTFASINWGSGAKFLHVMMGSVDLGAQQMLSVPYALYAESTNVSVSPTGDTLTIGGNNVIVPGISAANPINNTPTSGLGSQVLPGNTTCASEFISVTGCGGQTSLTYDGRTYDLVEIGGQCWFADNLATDQYRNGDPILTGLSNSNWLTSVTGAYSFNENDPANELVYGKLYNFYTIDDTRGLCPAGWHVPSDCEWMYLENSIGMSLEDQEQFWGAYHRGMDLGNQLKSSSFWIPPTSVQNNNYLFNALPGGYIDNTGNGFGIFSDAFWWTSSFYTPSDAFYRQIIGGPSPIIRGVGEKQCAFSVRCLKDASNAIIHQGCTDSRACNFIFEANSDDGTCIYRNSICDDSNSNTINDSINLDCQCAGANLGEGCTNVEACNYNESSTSDNGSCLFVGSICDDYNPFTANDVMNSACQCEGSQIAPLYIEGNGVTDFEGNFYSTVVINGHEWMQENLRVSYFSNGDPIPSGLNSAAWPSSGPASAIYNDDFTNISVYGRLYNAFAVNDSRGLCPIGWHVSLDTDWNSLLEIIDDSSIAARKLRSASIWNYEDEFSTNETGFSALPGGFRYGYGNYMNLGYNGYWWSGTPLSSDNPSTLQRNFRLGYNLPFLESNLSYLESGFSVRCVKN
jgi:uncharacterized protein (TIGR02145 family)